MYKHFLYLVMILLIAGCSKPQPQQPPKWYTNIPEDKNYLYAVGKSNTQIKAKNNAVISLRMTLEDKVNEALKTKTHILQPLNSERLNRISTISSDISKKLSLKNIKIIKNERFQGEELVLISIPRSGLFQKLKAISEAEFFRTKHEFDITKEAAFLSRYIKLNSLMQKFELIAVNTQYKDLLFTTYDPTDEFKFLNDMKNEYDELKSSTNIHVITDSNSRVYSSTIKEEINKNGLSTKNSFNGKNSLKLLITSQTQESTEYSFNKSQTLVKLTLFDSEKNKIAFRQHTFVGKSRKGHDDAKIHSFVNMKSKIKRLGIFDFIGIKK